MGGDSAAVLGDKLNVIATRKVFHNGPYLIGFAGSFRLGQILQYRADLPVPEYDENVEVFMATRFIDAVRQNLRDGGVIREREKQELGGGFLIGFRGAIYQVEENFTVLRNFDPFAAVGSGAYIALGALHALHFINSEMDPEARIRLALAASERWCSGVRAPFLIRQN